MHWKLASDSALLSRDWDGEYVVYNPANGDTCLLGEAAMQLLTRLRQQSSDLASLTRVVAEFRHADEGNDVVTLTETILQDLESLGLIERNCH